MKGRGTSRGAGSGADPGPAEARGAGALDDAVCRAIEQYAGAKNPAGLAQDLAESLRERFAAELAEVWTPGGEGGRLERAGACAAAGEPPPPDPLLAERPEALTCTPETGLSRFTGTFREWARANGAARVLLQPMRAGGCAAGLLAIYTRAPLSASLLAAAPLYASMASVALTDAGLFQENSKVINQLQFLVEASQKLNSTLDLAQLLDIILNMACQETEAERGSVFLVDRERREIWTILAHGLEEQEIRLSFGRGVAGHVAENGQTLNVADPYSCPFFDPSFDEKFNYRTRSLLCTPIRNRTGDIVGIMQLLNKKRGTFTGRDEEFLSALSVHMALALENARLHREMLEKQRLERELQLARNIQRSLLPDAPPSVPGYDIAVMNEPCFEVGGDYYDFLMLGPHTLLLVIADVEGKGVSSAMVMSNLQATLRALVMHLHSLEVITLSLNEMILADTHSEKYLSAFLGLVDTRRCGLHYINAGHVPPIVVRADGSVVPLTDGGMVIGLFNAVEYNRGSLRLLPGDIMVCCTDGITEAANLQDDEFGSERLAQVVHENRHLPAEELVNVIGREVSQFARGGPHIDDKVLMVVKVLEGFDPARAAEDSWSV